MWRGKSRAKHWSVVVGGGTVFGSLSNSPSYTSRLSVPRVQTADADARKCLHSTKLRMCLGDLTHDFYRRQLHPLANLLRVRA